MRKITVKKGAEAERGREKEYSLIVQMGDGDFTSSNRAGDLPKNKTAYTASVAEMTGYAEELERYDDFSQLQIPAKAYEKKKKSDKYGIERTETHAGDEVILKHQRMAVRRFLKELRGFGLLADIVGSGKTYEACAALSELAARGRINTLLLVVPEQVYDKWISVLELNFGLGEGVLYRADADLNDRRLVSSPDFIPKSVEQNFSELFVADDRFVRPTKPIIVSTRDFANWPEATCDVLFDAIVVDEAHHLCAEEGEYSYAMYRLSRLMQVKKKANKTYCILCSATPHSGDIEHMFRLWYFVRCNGGIPSDFEEKDDSERSTAYIEEREFYRTRVCHGAATVMEFMRKVSVEYAEREYLAPLTEYIVEKLKENGDDARLLLAYYGELGKRANGEYIDSELSFNEKFNVLKDFLRDCDGEVSERINSYVAGEYHNGVLGSIMIRQANRVGKKRTVVNYLFAPVKKINETAELYYRGRSDGAILDVAAMNGSDRVDDADMSSQKCVTFCDDKLTLSEYLGELERDKSARTRRYVYSSVMLDGKHGVLAGMGMSDKLIGEGKHTGALAYYEEQTKNTYGEGVYTRFVPTVVGKSDILEEKLKKLKNILDVNPNKRVLVFFDYERKNENVYEAVENALRSDGNLDGRTVIIGNDKNKNAAIAMFNETEGSILLAEDAALTEGVDMQTCNIIVNFQVTPDPIAMDQRIGRIFRLGQKNDIFIFSLADMRELEGYVLMYFARIGLLSSNSGDATIIAGCNNERSVTVRCKNCGKARMYDEDEYDRKAAEDSDDLYCTDTDLCKAAPGGRTRMNVIGTYDFKCDSCGEVLSRSEEGYKCRSTHANYSVDTHILCNGGGMFDRDIYCHKICAIANCRKFNEGGPLYGRCKALEKYIKNPFATEAALIDACSRCALNKPGSDCPEKCRLIRGDGRTGAALIRSCSHCNESTCSPKPFVLEFSKEKWECVCPSCGDGTMRPVRAHTFAEYVRSLWNYKFDSYEFCRRLKAEAEKVAYIKKILDNRTES